MDASWAENHFAGPVAWISIDFYRFSLTFIAFGRILGQKVKRPVATCGSLWAVSPSPKEELLDLSGGLQISMARCFDPRGWVMMRMMMLMMLMMKALMEGLLTCSSLEELGGFS